MSRDGQGSCAPVHLLSAAGPAGLGTVEPPQRAVRTVWSMLDGLLEATGKELGRWTRLSCSGPETCSPMPAAVHTPDAVHLPCNVWEQAEAAALPQA